MGDKKAIQDDEQGQSSRNDKLILDALATLGDPKRRKKLKVTQRSLQTLTGLSINTIRARSWALEEIESLKNAAKGMVKAEGVSNEASNEKRVPIEDVLRERIDNLLEQNGLLFQEILSLREDNKRLQAAYLQAKGGRLSAL